MTEVAAQLREAASLMRERAQATVPFPWHVGDDLEMVVAADDIDVAEAFALSGNQTRATATYIASMHPGVALAVADWLDWHATDADGLIEHGAYEADDLWSNVAPYAMALAVATAYLEKP